MNVSKEPTINAKEHLLSFFGLDKHYKLGRKDWLFYEKNGDLIKVLDLVGSYGINILGHNNPKIKATFKEIINSDQPAYIQGTKNPYAAELSAKIIHILNKETSFKERFCEFVSTGTEAVEIALKMCMLDYHTRIQEVNQQLNFTENFLQKTNHPDFKSCKT